MSNLVLDSIETKDGGRCVDLFRRKNGTYGFEIYRVDPEALTGWFAIGGFAEKSFAALPDAHEAAARIAPWIPQNR